MKIIEPSVSWLEDLETTAVYSKLENIARKCYKSEDKVKEGSAEKMLHGLIKSGHLAMIEHQTASLLFICDRGVSHEIVRHRIASYSQESTRYCNYSDDKFSNEITVIKPCFFDVGTNKYIVWQHACEIAEDDYFALLNSGCSPQEARCVLPNSLKTEITVTMNLREWRHFFNLRYLGTTGAPHPQMRQVAAMAFCLLYRRLPVIFEDQATIASKLDILKGDKVWEKSIAKDEYLYFRE